MHVADGMLDTPVTMLCLVWHFMHASEVTGRSSGTARRHAAGSSRFSASLHCGGSWACSSAGCDSGAARSSRSGSLGCPSDQPGRVRRAKPTARSIPDKDTLPETRSDKIMDNLLSKEEGVPAPTPKTGSGAPVLQPAESSSSNSAYSRRRCGHV